MPGQRAPPSLSGLPEVRVGPYEWEQVDVPPYPLCAFGFVRDDLKALYGKQYQSDWWGVALRMGRAPFVSKFRGARNASFESFAPIGRALAPVRRHLIRGRAAALQGGTAVGQESVSAMGFETASPFLQLVASSAEFGDLLRSSVGDSPQSVALALAARPEFVCPPCSLEPLEVSAGAVFAIVTRAPHSVRLIGGAHPACREG